MKICPVGVQLFHMDRRTDRTKLIVAFRNFATASKKLTLHICLFLARQPPVGQGLIIHEVSRTHTTTHHSR